MKYIILLIILYLFLHNPLIVTFGGLGIIKLLYLLFFLFLSQKYRSSIYKYKKIIFIYLAIVFYTILRTSIGGNSLFIYTSLISFIETFLLSYIIAKIFIIKNVPLIRSLLIVGAVGCVISLLCFLNPTINSFIKNNVLILSDYLNSAGHRGFGISDGLTYSYGIVQGIIFSIGLFYIKKNKWFIVFMPIVIFSILINARIGMLPIIIALCVNVYKNGMKSSLIYFSILAICSFYAFTNIDIETINSEAYSYSSDFFLEMFDFVSGTNTARYSTVGTLFGKMFVLPQQFSEWVIGSGKDIFIEYGRSTDVGFLLQLNYGGLVYMGLLISIIVCYLKDISNIKYTWLIIFFVCTIICCNIKGPFIPNSGGFRLITLLIIYISLEIKNKHSIN